MIIGYRSPLSQGRGFFISLKVKEKIYPLVDQSVFHEACGTGFIVAHLGKPETRVLPLALKALHRLAHRGAISADNETGDGTGILTDIPRPFFREVLKEDLKVKLQFRRPFGVAMVFTTRRKFQWFEETASLLLVDLE